MVLAESADMGLGSLTGLINSGVVGVACALAVFYVVRAPRVERERHEREQEKLKADREYELERAQAQQLRDAELRDWHSGEVTKITASVEKVATAVDKLEARVADLPCKTHMISLPGGSSPSRVG